MDLGSSLGDITTPLLAGIAVNLFSRLLSYTLDHCSSTEETTGETITADGASSHSGSSHSGSTD